MRQRDGSGAWGISHLRGVVLAFVVAVATALGSGVVSAEPVASGRPTCRRTPGRRNPIT
ncbi:hypothetical protein ACRS5S_32565 [Nocardia asiatica]|uniref:hypothetical protein n=1 Tax=Nocardia asiatica TaxID=209252 RepID=UPI003EDFFDF6